MPIWCAANSTLKARGLSGKTCRLIVMSGFLLGLRLAVLDECLETGELLGDHAVGQCRQLAEAALHVAADGIDEAEISAAVLRFQAEGQCTVEAVALERTERAAGAQR